MNTEIGRSKLAIYKDGKYDIDSSFNNLYKILPEIKLVFTNIEIEIITNKGIFYNVDIYLKGKAFSLIQYRFHNNENCIGTTELPPANCDYCILRQYMNDSEIDLFKSITELISFSYDYGNQ